MAGGKFVAKLVSRKGKRLSKVSRIRNRVTELFYSLPREIRRTKVQPWYCAQYQIPKYLFRLAGRSLSDKQKIVSTIFRIHNAYVMNLKGINPSRAAKHGADGSLHRVLPRLRGMLWYAVAEIAYRRLKVLLSPLRQ
jgi:hypothetical protein